MELAVAFLASVIIFATVFGPSDTGHNDNATFRLEEGQSITFDSKSKLVYYYDEEENRTYVHDGLTDELLYDYEGEQQ